MVSLKAMYGTIHHINAVLPRIQKYLALSVKRWSKGFTRLLARAAGILES